MSSSESKRCWIIADNKAGMINQAIGLAEALGYPFEIKTNGLKWPWNLLTPFVRLPYSFCQSEGTDELKPPWPDVIITCGRQSILPALWVKKMSKDKAFLIKIQNPQISLSLFDLVVTPQHDLITGSNVIQTIGSLHRVTNDVLDKARLEWSETFKDLPKPIFSVIIGGNSKHYEMTPDKTEQFMSDLVTLAKKKGGSLCVTVSRRTPDFARSIIAEKIKSVPHFFYEGEGPNPYFALMAFGDFLFVTEDSVSMVSEALSTGKPTYLLPLESKGSNKFKRFHDAVYKAGLARPFTGTIEVYDYKPLYETKEIAERIKASLR
ncbi:MAG: mitochondrial fission ELM1 family protein [Alphaproteobacteria bacterium]|jgi:mitochondrial fission protein ELM1|nr:mitochondrial fission ELM1 family protein [Alphaproteobacteria bacterium]MBP9878311.1 mitochondrial fission ELM1 family protein [Alphaproteobacteria bacterium]